MSTPTSVTIEEPPRRRGTSPGGWALWQLGFRPFYLLASVFGALSIALWAVQLGGWLERPYLQGPMWHAHEMLFGFTLAVVVGFLLTAVPNWTQRPTASGYALVGLAALWVAGRVLVLTPYGWASALVGAAFPLAAAVAIGIPLVAARNRRNYFFIGILAMLSASQLLFHLGQLGVVSVPPWIGLQLGLDTVLVVLVLMTGRVVPMFTNNGVPGAQATRHLRVEQLAIGLVLALWLADALHLPGPAVLVLAGLGGLAHLVRWLLWKPWRTMRVPLVWVLHAAYLWIPVHLALRAAAVLGTVPSSAATHALTIGAAGGLIIGMMTRTARGHTGLPLLAGRAEVTCFALILGAALIRVLVPLFDPAAMIGAVLASAIFWTLGFALFAWRYTPVLMRPRVDGRPG